MYLTEIWRMKAQRYVLTGSRDCQTCEIRFPPRPVAPREVEAYHFDRPERKRKEKAAWVVGAHP